MTKATVVALLATLVAAASAPLVATPAATDACARTPTLTSQNLTPQSGYSVRLGRFDGILYYTVAHNGYQLVATFVSGGDQRPIRLIATLMSGQHVTISVPGGPGEPSSDLRITRASDALLVGYTSPCAPTD